MRSPRTLDPRALTAQRKARRRAFPSPRWGDHVLNGVRMFTVAKKLDIYELVVREMKVA